MRAMIGLLILFFGMGLSLQAQAPQRVHYQGRLMDGTNLVNGTVGLSLRLYDAESGGALLYEDSNGVVVVDGLYQTDLGDQTNFGNLPAALSNAAVWVETWVNGVALSPRERLGSVPYALLANELVGPLKTSATGVGIGTTNPAPSSLLDIQSTNRGVLLSRMTQGERLAISNPAPGLLVYQTDATNFGAGFYYYTGTNWSYLVNQSTLPYTDTELVSYVQDNGTVYFRAAINPSVIANLINVPGRAITYLATTYFTSGFPAPSLVITTVGGAVTNAVATLFPIASDPTTAEFVLNPPITTVTTRPLEVRAIGSIGGANYVNFRSLVIGYRPTSP